MVIEHQKLQDFVNRKTFATRGEISPYKKMWRDGYNKALSDFLTFIEMNQPPVSGQNGCGTVPSNGT